jgi:hypothetical protein
MKPRKGHADVTKKRLVYRACLGSVVGALLCFAGLSPASAAAAAWSVVPSPNNGTGSNFLQGVSCASAGSCTAVGYYYSTGGTTRTLAESWNGTKWSVVPSPSNGTAANDLDSVSCVSARACTAVGDTNSGGSDQTLAERWNGTKWSVVPSPSNGTGSNDLFSVSCASASSCLAVGIQFNSANVIQTLAERWNGTKWSVVPSPDKGTSTNYLNNVSCATARACTAVGVYVNSAGTVQTLAESWNGTKWSMVPSADHGTGSNYLEAVSCVSSSSCTAVGNYINSTGVTRSLAESWNGTRWSVVPSPNNGTSVTENALFGLSCASASSCTAVGHSNSIGGNTRTLAESWNGTKWSLVSIPNEGTGSNILFGASCASASSCTAIGYHITGSGISRTLAERHA